MNITLRDYQSSAIHSLRAAYRAGHRAPLLVCPTGGGKTIMFAAITQSAAARGNRVLILVHRRELIRQASQKLSQADVPHGLIAAGIPEADHPVQVASVQTLARRLAQLAWKPDLIVIDEAHHAVAGTWRKILEHWPHALRLGVTATPLRQDGRGLCSMFDHLVNGPSVATLTDDGFLCTAKIFAPPPVADLSGLRTRAGDFKAEELTERLNKPLVTGDAIDHYQRLGNHKRAIAFCVSTDHAQSVSVAFNSRGVPAATLLGSTPSDERDDLVRQFAAGTIRVLVTVDVVSEGFDCPAAEVAILLRPTQSEGLYLQQVGRVLRPAPDKPHALILDHVGNVRNHGFPDDDRQWSLADRPRRAKGDTLSVRTCHVCFATFKPQPRCPVCGAYCAGEGRERQPLEHVDGELVELKRKVETPKILVNFGQHRPPATGYEYVSECEDGNYMIRLGRKNQPFKILKDRVTFLGKSSSSERKEAMEEEARQRTAERKRARSLPELLAVAKERGYSPGWAYKVHNARSRAAQ